MFNDSLICICMSTVTSQATDLCIKIFWQKSETRSFSEYYDQGMQHFGRFLKKRKNYHIFVSKWSGPEETINTFPICTISISSSHLPIVYFWHYLHVFVLVLYLVNTSLSAVMNAFKWSSLIGQIYDITMEPVHNEAHCDFTVVERYYPINHCDL